MRSETVPTVPPPQVGVFALFLTFSRASLSGFGGMPFWTRREVVERQRWLTERGFVEVFALGQLRSVDHSGWGAGLTLGTVGLVLRTRCG